MTKSTNPQIPDLDGIPDLDESAPATPGILEEIDVDDIDEDALALLAVGSGQSFAGSFHIVNPPKDKVLYAVCERDIEQGLFTIGWQDYTQDQYDADQRHFQTRLAARPKNQGGRLWVKKHWYKWMTMSLSLKIEALRKKRDKALRTGVQFESSGLVGESTKTEMRVAREGKIVEAEGEGSFD